MIIIASVCFALFFVEVNMFHLKWKLNFKPFNCTSCLASWVAITLYFVPRGTEPVLYMFGAGVLAPLGRVFLHYLYKNMSK